MKIKSYWQYEKGKWNEEHNEYIQRTMSPTKEKILDVILDTGSHRHEAIVHFNGGPTGFESYYLKSLLEIDWQGDQFVICGGTINSWACCWVKSKDLNEILSVFKDAMNKHEKE